MGAGARIRAGMGACVCARVGRRACVGRQACALRVGIRAFGRGVRLDRLGARVSSWYPRAHAHDRTPRGVAQKFFMLFYLRVC